MTNRQKLIAQLRQILYLVESPKETLVEFDILDTTFEVELEQEALLLAKQTGTKRKGGE
jgi:hypothetical protein